MPSDECGAWPSSAGPTQVYPGKRVLANATGHPVHGGGLPFLSGSLTTPLTGALGRQDLLTMATCMAGFFGLAAIASITLRDATAHYDMNDSPTTMAINEHPGHTVEPAAAA